MKTKRTNPSLPHIICTGLILIGMELHWSWEQSTPRERSAIVVAMAVEQKMLVGMMTTLSNACGISGVRGNDMR
jgi:hypothetical protein